MSFKPSKPSLLLVVDLHQIEVEPLSSWGPRSTPNLTSNVSTLLDFFRKKSLPIIHIHHQSQDPSDELYPKEENAKFIAAHPCAAPLPHEPILVKNTGSPFASTKLEETLLELGGKEREIVVIGMEGAKCINSTVRGGSDLGFRMVVVVDACASFGVSYFGSEKVGAEEVHRVSMGILDGYARLGEMEGVVGELEEWR